MKLTNGQINAIIIGIGTILVAALVGGIFWGLHAFMPGLFAEINWTAFTWVVYGILTAVATIGYWAEFSDYAESRNTYDQTPTMNFVFIVGFILHVINAGVIIGLWL